MGSLTRLLAALALATSLTVQASPLGGLYSDDFGADFNETSPFTLGSRQNRVELRIMPLGASIMEGLKSSTHAGSVIHPLFTIILLPTSDNVRFLT